MSDGESGTIDRVSGAKLTVSLHVESVNCDWVLYRRVFGIGGTRYRGPQCRMCAWEWYDSLGEPDVLGACTLPDLPLALVERLYAELPPPKPEDSEAGEEASEYEAWHTPEYDEEATAQFYADFLGVGCVIDEPHRSKYAKRHSVRDTLVSFGDFRDEDWPTIVEAFGRQCAYCGATDRPLTMDHVKPIMRGGDHTAANIVPACKSCNSRKSRTPLRLWLKRNGPEFEAAARARMREGRRRLGRGSCHEEARGS